MSVTLCGRKNGCCPELNKIKGKYVISDKEADEKITLTGKQLDNLQAAKKELDKPKKKEVKKE